jgi:hypothetical protein
MDPEHWLKIKGKFETRQSENGGKLKKFNVLLLPHQRRSGGMLKIKGKFETRQGEK